MTQYSTPFIGNTHLVIRPVCARDKSAVFEVIRYIWDDDYIRYVWDDWIVAQEQPFLVAEVAGEVVGLARLGDLGYGEGWFQGLRVAKRVRGQGIGRQLLARCVELSRERGDHCLRLITDGDNVAMQHAAVATGLQLELASVWLWGTPLEQSEPLVVLQPDQLPRLLDDLQSSELETRYSGIYAIGWRYLLLRPERLAQHVRQGEVQALPNSNAWAIVHPDDEAWIGYAFGAGQDLNRLLGAIRAQHALPERRLRVLVPHDSLLRHTLVDAGYNDEGEGAHCYSIAF